MCVLKTLISPAADDFSVATRHSAHYNERMPIRSFRDLVVWQKSMALAERVYELTETFPVTERYALSIQLKRTAVSIPSNIAEGHTRRTGSYLHHLNIALGSEAELQTQLELAHRLKLTTRSLVEPLIEEAATIGRMLRGLAASVEHSHEPPDP
jgi:four helix bundle protein